MNQPNSDRKAFLLAFIQMIKMNIKTGGYDLSEKEEGTEGEEGLNFCWQYF